MPSSYNEGQSYCLCCGGINTAPKVSHACKPCLGLANSRGVRLQSPNPTLVGRVRGLQKMRRYLARIWKRFIAILGRIPSYLSNPGMLK